MTKQEIIDTLWHLSFQFDGDKAVIDKHTIGTIADTLLAEFEQEKKEQAKEIFRAIRGCEHHSVLRQEEHSEWWESVWTASELIPIAKEYGVEL